MVYHVPFVLGIVCTVCVLIVLQVLDVLVKRSRSGSRTILLYCITFLWRYLPIKLPGILVLAPRWCEANRCFIDRSRECRYNKGFRHGGTSREAIYYDVTCCLMNEIRDTAEQGSVFYTDTFRSYTSLKFYW